MPAEVDVAIIGAGVVGLAIAGEIAQQRKGVFVFEKNRTFGLETSSRNSEVIHAGLYYPEGSLKAKLCIEGKHLLYELCGRHGIPHKKLGKLIIAVSDDEIPELEQICQQAAKSGVTDLTLLSGAEIKKLEPNVEGKAGLMSPSTGVIDSHSLMQFFHKNALESGVEFLFETEVTSLEMVGTRWKVQIRDWEGVSDLTANVVINSAGLDSDRAAHFAGMDIAKAGYELHYCKGEYFSLDSKWRSRFNSLIYPIPDETCVGIHLTSGLDGMMRLGPNARYVGSIDYKVDKTQKDSFYQFARRFLPFIELDDLQPEFAGIRPKLQAPGEDFRDFVVTHEERTGFPGLINLIGIESPGLTATPAIARYVGQMVKELLN